MTTLIRRIVAVLLASCLVGDPSTCQAFNSFPQPSAHTAVVQPTLFTDQALTLRLTSYFKGWAGRAATLAGFHEMQNFAESQDLEIAPDGTAAIRPFDFGPIFSKSTREKRSAQRAEKRTQAKAAAKEARASDRNISRRAFLGAAFLAGSGSAYWYLTRKSTMPQWENAEQMRSFISHQIDQVTEYAHRNNRDEEAQILDMFRSQFVIEDLGLINAAVRAKIDAEGRYLIYPQYGKPSATLIIDRLLLTDLAGVDRQTADLYVQSLIWKEVGTTMPRWRNPDSQRTRRTLEREVFEALRPFGDNINPSDPRVIAMLQNPDYRKKVQTVAAMTGYHEAAGYVEQMKFFRDHGWTSIQIEQAGLRNSEKKLASTSIQATALFMRIVDADGSDALRLAALAHISEILLRAQHGKHPGNLALQEAIFRLALEAEAVEERVPRVNGRPQVPEMNIAAPRFPSNYFPYLSDPNFYDPQPKTQGWVQPSPAVPAAMSIAGALRNRNQIGADTGGNMVLMSRLLRLIDKLHFKTFGPQKPPRPRAYRLHQLVRNYRSGASPHDAALIASVRKDAERLLRKAGLPRPHRSKQPRIILIDLPNEKLSVQRFVRRYIEPGKGIGALRYELSGIGHVIVMRREEFTAERLAHDLGEIALMQRDPTMYWTMAHNLVFDAGLGRGRIDLLHLPIMTDPEAEDSAISSMIQPVHAEVSASIFTSHGIHPSPELITELHQGFEVFYEQRNARNDVLEEIAVEKMEKDGVDLSQLSSRKYTMEILRFALQETRHFPSDVEILRETFIPILARHGIEPDLGKDLLGEIAALMHWEAILEAIFATASGAPLGDLIDKLIDAAELSESQAQNLAKSYALQLGWTDAQFTEGLRTRTLATSQNAIGADAGGDVVQQNSPQKVLRLWLQGAYPDTFGREGGDVPYWLDGFWEEVTSKPVDWQEKPELSAILQRLFEWRLHENGPQKQIAQELGISVNQVRTYESLIRHILRFKALAYRDRAHPEKVLSSSVDTSELPYWPTEQLKKYGIHTNRDLVRRIKAGTFPPNVLTKQMTAQYIRRVRQLGLLDLPDVTAPLDPLDHSIEILGLFSKASFGLNRPESPVKTLRELVRLSESDLRRPPYNMTVRSVREVQAKLALMGLKLADNPSSQGSGLTKDLVGFMTLGYVGGIEAATWIGAASGMPLLGVTFGTAVPLALGVLLFRTFFPQIRRPASEFLRAA